MMAEQNILAGDVNVLDQMINDLNVHKETIERQGRLAESIGDIAKNTKEAQQAVQDEIDSRVKDSSDAVCAGFDKAIAGDREKLKEVQNKRDKAKLAGVKERIAAETAHIHKENEALKNQVKDAFAQENIPMFCNSRIYIALYRTKRMTDVLIYLLCIALVYAAVPFLLSVIPQFPLWGMILYYVVVILIQSFTNKMIVEKTLVRHAETIDMAKKLKEQIRSNHKKMKKIAKNIKTDSNEEMYGLHEFDDKMNEIREDMKRIEQEKEKALEECLGIANMANILFVRQKQTLGLGHAVNTAKAFTGDDPFVVIYGDDVIWGEDPVCAQLIRAYEEFGRPVAGVSAVPWEDVSRYCSLKTTPIHDNYFFVDDMIEKPKKGQEFSNYSILGRVLLTPEIYEILAHTKPGAGGEIQLTDAMAEYARTRGGMTAVEFTGKHYDMGNKLKVVEAQVELALQHPEIGEEFRAYLKEFCKTL